MEFIKLISEDFLFWLLPCLLLDDVHIVLLKTLGHWVLLSFFALVLDCCNLVMSNQFCVLLFGNCEVMVTQTALVSDLLRNELTVVSSWDALVKDLLLIGAREQIGVHELGHFYVVGEDVKRNFFALGNSYEFISISILFVCFALGQKKVFVFCECTSFESSNWGKNFAKLFIIGNRLEHNSTVLSIEELSHIESMSIRLVLGKLMEQESVFMLI